MSSVLEQALKALRVALSYVPGGVSGMDTHESLQMKQAIAALEEAITEQGEPVARWNWREAKLEWLTPYRREFNMRPMFFTAPTISEGWRPVFSRVLACLRVLNERPRPMCRDCADGDGIICAESGLNCDMRALIAEAMNLLLAAAPKGESE